MKQYKIIVVGQGLAGTLFSFQLYKNGIPHIVIADPVERSASHVAAGMFNPLVFKRITKSWMADKLLPVMFDVYAELENLLSEKFLYHKPIAKLISPEEKSWWNERIQSQELQDYIHEFVPHKSIKGVNPHFEAVLLKKTGYVDAGKLINAYRKFLIERRLLIEGNFTYDDIKYSRAKVSWNAIRADKIVFCEGAKATTNPYFNFVDFYLTKGDVLDVHISDLSEEYIINKDVFLLPIGENTFKLGSTYNHNDLSDNIDPEAAKYLIKKAEEILRADIKLLNHKVGVRPTVKDRRPVLGFHPNHTSLAMFNGLGTKGVMLGPYFAQMMFRLLTDPDCILDKEVRLGRFI